MKILEIAEKYKELNIYEERKRTAEYDELVFYKSDIKDWDKVLKEIFGEAVKPEGAKPSQEAKTLTKDFGGIRSEQVLYKKDVEDGRILAMIWPWQDPQFATLKVVYLKTLKGE